MSAEMRLVNAAMKTTFEAVKPKAPRRYGLDVEHGEYYSDTEGPWVRHEDCDTLQLRYEEVCGERDELLKVLARVREYFDERADCDQPSGEAPNPNDEMTLLVAIDAVLPTPSQRKERSNEKCE